MAATTGRLALTYPQPSDSNNVPGDIQRLAQQLDLLAVVYLRDVAANRPNSVAPAGVPAQGNYQPGTQGRWFYATDTGTLSYDYGGGWRDMTSALNLLTTRGDLVVGMGPAQAARLPVGGDGRVLVARSGAASGVNWEAQLGMPLGLPGAATATRFVGATSTNGPPSSGTFLAGDVVTNPIGGRIWICSVGGTPGTWIEVGSQVPVFCAYQQNQSIPSVYYYNLTGWASAGVDTHGAITSAGYVIPKAGVWHFDFNVMFAANRYGERFARLVCNGDPGGGANGPGRVFSGVGRADNEDDAPCSVHGSLVYPVRLNIGDVIGVQGAQNSGSTVRTNNGATDFGTTLSGTWLHS